MHVITDTPRYHLPQVDINMRLESNTYFSAFMNQGHYLIKLLMVFVKILMNCKSFIDIRLSDYLSTNKNAYHPASPLCLNWFKRYITHILKMSNCKLCSNSSSLLCFQCTLQ